MIFTLPVRFDYLTKSTKINYEGKNLRTIYLLHIIDHVIKEYNNYEPTVPLYSKVLKQIYGNHYSDYIDYLVKTRFISKVKSHSTRSHTSTLYKLTDKLSGVMTYKKDDYILIKKLNKYYSSLNPLTKISPIPKEIRHKLIDDLNYVTVDFDKSLSYISKFEKIDPIKYSKNLSMISKINDHDLFKTFDKFGRFHTNFTNLKKDIRNQYMMIDNQPIGFFDIKSSQPFFLSQLLKYDPLVSKNKEVIKFIQILEDSTQDIYMYFVNRYPKIFNHPDPKINRDNSKNYVIKSMYDRKNKNSKYKSMFRKEFPFILDFMENYKRNEGRELWSSLQRVESEFIFKKVYMSIIEEFPDIKLLTIHDSIYFPLQYNDGIQLIWENHRENLLKMTNK